MSILFLEFIRSMKQLTRVRAPWAACCGLAAILLHISLPAWANDPVTSELAALDDPVFIWSPQQEMLLFGIPVFLRDFTASTTLQNAAQSLAANTDRFQRVLAFKDTIMLSGRKSDRHWVAQLESTPYGVRGLVSVLSIDPELLVQALKNRDNGLFNWLPQQATLLFSQLSGVKSRRVTQQVYSVALRPDDLAAYLQMHLRRSDWSHEPQVDWLPSASIWRRNSARLMLITTTAADGSFLFVHHSE